MGVRAAAQETLLPAERAASPKTPATAEQWKHAARRSLERGDVAQARAQLAQMLQVYRDQRGQEPQAWSLRLIEVAREYLRAGELKLATDLLGEAADGLPTRQGEVNEDLASAMAAWHRRLNTLDVAARFDLLYAWSMPSETRPSLRVLTAITPVDAPPAVFARALGERIRPDSFAVPDVAEVSGFFCSAWELVLAAHESGNLRRLTADLSRLAETDADHARFVWTLARIASTRGEDVALLDELLAHVTALQNPSADSPFVTLPLAQRVWQFGYGRFDNESQRTAEFAPLPHWDGSIWRGAIGTDTEIGVTLRDVGGHPGTGYAAIRRWVAPASGQLVVAGILQRPDQRGNGIRGQLISSRSGLAGHWIVRSGPTPTTAEPLRVERGDTIDLMVDAIDGNPSYDTFQWTAEFELRADDGRVLSFPTASGFHGPAQSSADLVIAAACLSQHSLQPVGEQLLKTRLEQSQVRDVPPALRTFLRRAHAEAVLRRSTETSPDLIADAGLKWWLPARGQRVRHQPGAARPLWLAHDEHLYHLAGPGHDHLLFRYPLTGEFELSCEVQNGGPGGTDGGFVYGGLEYELTTQDQTLRVWTMDRTHLAGSLHTPFAANPPVAEFNRLALRSMPAGVTLYSNQHAVWTDAGNPLGSPWLGLQSVGERAPLFRNLRLTGTPVIPREVRLTDDNTLRGWIATDFAGDTQESPETGVNGFLRRLTVYKAWSAHRGVLHGNRQSLLDETVAQNHIYYFRPLQHDETVSYEFEYEPGRLEVHPTLGRLAFLIEPDGVRLHWVTDGELEWTGLPDNHGVLEPLNRRGPKPLPLNAGGWNRVELALQQDTLTLSLNGTLIYTRRMEADAERTFGLYHDRHRSEARVRGVILRGDWPAELRLAEVQGELLALHRPARTLAERRALGAILDDQHVLDAAYGVHRRALQLPVAERYAYLRDWVLPSADHATLRLALGFTPTNPAPPVSDVALETIPAGASRVTTGGELIAPALDLVQAAKELNKLDELRTQVAAIQPAEAPLQQRRLLEKARWSLLAIIEIEAGQMTQATQNLHELASLVVAETPRSFADQWPETLAIVSALPHAESREAVRDMAFHIIGKQIRKNVPSGSEVWDQHLRSVVGRLRFYDLADRDPGFRDLARARSPGQSPLADWIPVSRESTRTRGKGFPRSRWETTSAALVESVANHEDDYLFYRLPLRGNFQVECDITAFGWREMNLWVAGQWVAPVYTLSEFDVGDMREWRRQALAERLSRVGDWIHYRAVVQDGICTTYFNGRKVQERPLAADHDPWVAIRSPHTTSGAVRNLRIVGEPTIPEAVCLTSNEDLPGWWPINQGHNVGPNRKWQQLGELEAGGGIRGIRWPDLQGSNRETLLRYHRPLAEDGTIDYEFFYRSGEVHVHPALDRLAFMLLPDGVRVHWITDGKFERTELTPDNLFDEPGHRRGPGTLPLLENGWNRVRLALAGDVVELSLNCELVFVRPLEPTNQRTLGLFHYADQTEVQVRNIVWRGNWPRALPRPAAQELAGPGAEFLDETSASLAASFEHDFADGGFPSATFGLTNGNSEQFSPTSEGLLVTRPSGPGYNDSEFAPHLRVEGDFDITAAWEQFDPHPPLGGSSGVYLRLVYDSEQSHESLVSRRHVLHRREPQPMVQAEYVTREAGGARRDRYLDELVEAPAGRFRIARRGDRIYYLFAENDSPQFRVLATEQGTTAPIRTNGLRLMTQAQGDGGLTKVVWKHVSIRAEKLEGLALLDSQRVLAELDAQRTALPQEFQHDFGTDPFTIERFHRWGPLQPEVKKGLNLQAVGRDNWTSSGISAQVGLEGDFDVSVTFDDLQLGLPKPQQNSALYLQIGFPDKAETQVNIMVILYPEGERQVVVQNRLMTAGGGYDYQRIRSEHGDDVSQLRIARRGSQISYVYRKRDAERDEVLAQVDIGVLPVPKTNLRILLHTGGSDLLSQVVLKQLNIRAQKLDLPQ